MEENKSVTVAALRELARKHLGAGHSKLKTKAELVAALAANVPDVAAQAGLVVPGKGRAKVAARGKAAAAAKTPAAKAKARLAPAAAAKVKPGPVKKATAAASAAARKATAAASAAAKKVAAMAAASAKKVADAAPPAAKKRADATARAARKAPPAAAAKRPATAAAAAVKERAAAGAKRPAARARKAAAVPPTVDAALPEAPPAQPTPRAEVMNFPARPRPKPEPSAQQASTVEPPAGEWPAAASIPAGAAPPSAEPAPPLAPPVHTEEPFAMEQHEAEPLVEGFFVARVAGEHEARRHHLSHDTTAAGDLGDGPGELPEGYADDASMALPRDPHTLFVFWDFSAATRERALQGLTEPRAVLRVYDGEGMVREQDFALESRSFYVHGLQSGRAYRVEFHFVGRDGRSRRIGHSTNRVQLPPAGPSPDTSVRFMRVPSAGTPRAGALEPQPAALPPVARVHEYITWRRVSLPSSGYEDLLEVRRDAELPSSSPPSGPTHLEPPARSEGSSEQTSWTPSPSGRGR